jgi:hypothetical protein
MALGLTQPLTEMSTRDISWGVKDGQRVRLTTSQLSERRLSKKCGNLKISQASRPSRPVTGRVLPYLLLEICSDYSVYIYAKYRINVLYHLFSSHVLWMELFCDVALPNLTCCFTWGVAWFRYNLDEIGKQSLILNGFMCNFLANLYTYPTNGLDIRLLYRHKCDVAKLIAISDLARNGVGNCILPSR